MDLLDSQPPIKPRAKPSANGLVPMESAVLLKPVEPPNYTDFYASIHHATRVGRLFRPENPLLPNYMYVPIGYHGRASSIVVQRNPDPSSERPVQTRRSQVSARAQLPTSVPRRFLDYELEVGLYIRRRQPAR